MTNVKYSTRNRQSGTTILLFDRTEPDVAEAFDKATNRWVIVCQEHSRFSDYVKQNDAYKAMTNPTWCLDCKGLMTRGEKVGPVAKEGNFEEFKSRSVQRREAAQAGEPAPEWAGSLTEQSTGAPSPQEISGEQDPEIAPLEGSEPEDASSNLVQSQKPITQMTPGERELNNVCYKCGGPLKSRVIEPIDHFHSTGLPARAVCCQCVGHVADAAEA